MIPDEPIGGTQPDTDGALGELNLRVDEHCQRVSAHLDRLRPASPPEADAPADGEQP
jgi:hypothetical protein